MQNSGFISKYLLLLFIVKRYLKISRGLMLSFLLLFIVKRYLKISRGLMLSFLLLFIVKRYLKISRGLMLSFLLLFIVKRYLKISRGLMLSFPRMAAFTLALSLDKSPFPPYISLSSCRAASTDIPDPLSPLLPIIHRLRQVFRVTSCVLT